MVPDEASGVLSIALILIVSIGLIAVIGYTSLSKNSDPQFRVGLTFGGDNSAEAKQLIDKVKSYTNLFVLASGLLMYNITEIENICDYSTLATTLLNQPLQQMNSSSGTRTLWEPLLRSILW